MALMMAPVVMFGFNRPELQAEVLRRYVLCDGAKDRDIFMFLDGPRNDADKNKTERVFQLALKYQNQELPRLRIIRRERNYGCRENIVQGITQILNKFGRAIMIEDDILVSRTFLTFMDAALEFYRKDYRFWCINGYNNYFLRIPHSYKYDVYCNVVNCAWGWATWKDRWDKVDFDMKDWASFIAKPDSREQLDKCGIRIYTMLQLQHEGKLKTWDVQCMYYMIKNSLYAISPVKQLSKNIGCIPGGVHYVEVDPLMSLQKYYNFMPMLTSEVSPDRKIMARFRYMSFNPNLLSRVYRKICRVIARYMKPCVDPIEMA